MFWEDEKFERTHLFLIGLIIPMPPTWDGKANKCLEISR